MYDAEPSQMCAGAAVQARLDRVVIGAMNAKAGCAGSIINLLDMQQLNHQIPITKGVLETGNARRYCQSFLNVSG